MRKFMPFIAWILCLMLLLGTFSATAHAAYVGDAYISAAGACVMDFETGEVLYTYYGDTNRVPASMTKLMTVYLVYEALGKGEIALDTIVPISTYTYNMSRNPEYTGMPLYYNANYTVDELLDITVVYSANAAAAAFAELLGGTEQGFVIKMNEKAKELGLNAVFYDSSGLSDYNKISPIDMAKLVRSLIMYYPEVLERTSKKSVVFRGATYKSTNRLLDTYFYEGADGMKTGTTTAAGYCFCGTAVRNGRRMIAVAMKSSSGNQRFIDVSRLLDFGFKQGEYVFDSIYFTDMRTFVNGEEIPMFYYKGKNQSLIIAEDLKDYGYQTYFDEESMTFYATRDTKKATAPVPMEYYRGMNGVRLAGIEDSVQCTVIIQDGDKSFAVTEAYRTKDYTYFSVDTLQYFYNFRWDSTDRAVYIDTAA